MAAILPTPDLLGFLATVGADRDDSGRFALFNEPPIVGLGGDELVIPDGTRFTVGGAPRPLASELVTAGAAVAVKVIS